MSDNDDWGCVSEEDLFFSCGSTKSLDELVESITSSPAIEDLLATNSFPLSDGSQNVQVSLRALFDDTLGYLELLRHLLPSFIKKVVYSAWKAVYFLKVVPCVLSSSAPNRCAPKILKKRGVIYNIPTERDRRASLKRVTFEVEKFAADECEDGTERENGRARLAMQLGARAPKKQYVNYKALKTQLSAAKMAPPQDEKLSALSALKKTTAMKKKAKAKAKKLHK
ncbi:unnamed protein product [Toxocara canis]|uniref:40S ribosomal protein S6 n=1 Tax=Toxocara canis TaxID=6265 RepID=A0A183UQD0_TOXCA|nr:unnamed protein product [Toxocara canis]